MCKKLSKYFYISSRAGLYNKYISSMQYLLHTILGVQVSVLSLRAKCYRGKLCSNRKVQVVGNILFVLTDFKCVLIGLVSTNVVNFTLYHSEAYNINCYIHMWMFRLKYFPIL